MLSRCVLMTCLLLPFAAAEASKLRPAPERRPFTVEEAASAVGEAFAANDTDRLRAFLLNPKPDPWLVAEELCYRQENDAAEAFARAASFNDVKRLPAYVAAMRGKARDEAGHAMILALRKTMDARDYRKTLALTEGGIALDSVTRIRIASWRSFALSKLRKHRACARLSSEVGRAALRLGWLVKAEGTLRRAGKHAYYDADWKRAKWAWESALRAAEEIVYEARIANTRFNLGRLHMRLLDDAKAREHFELALQMERKLGRLSNIAQNKRYLGMLEARENKQREALALYDEALAIEQAIARRIGMARTIRHIGIAHAELGESQRAIDCYRAAITLERAVRNRVGVALNLGNLGDVQRRLGEEAKALENYRTALEIVTELGYRPQMFTFRHNLGLVSRHLGRYAESIEHHEAALRIARDLGSKPSVVDALASLSDTYRARGDYEEALTYGKEALRVAQELGRPRAISRAQISLGNVHLRLDDHVEAIACYEVALHLKRRTGDRSGAATALHNLGDVKKNLGALMEAGRLLRSALAIREELGIQDGIASTLNAMGNLEERLGNYAQALRHHERSLAIRRRLGNPARLARTLNDLGVVEGRLGNHRSSLARYDAALRIVERLGLRSGEAKTLTNMGIAHYLLENHETALALHERSLELHQELDDKDGVAGALHNMGQVLDKLGDYTKALEHYEKSLAIQRALGRPAGIARRLMNIAGTHRNLGNRSLALAKFEEVRRLVEPLSNRRMKADATWGLALLHLETGQPGKALALARDAVTMVAQLTEGLAEAEGAGARDRFSGLFDVGYLAAMRAGRADDLLWFMERGRAGSLHEHLGSRGALEAALLSPELHEALARARQSESRASEALRQARTAQDLKGAKAAHVALEEAHTEFLEVTARIERESKAAASVVLSDPDGLAAIRGYLRPQDALVYYGLTGEGGLALVVRREGARIVKLPATRAIEAAMSALLDDNKQHIVPAAVDGLRRRVVAPLELGREVERVLISPVGRLAYVPFATLLPDKEVSFVPSGTTYGFLREERGRRGEKVLALGDPDYGAVIADAGALQRGGRNRLRRLAESRKEVDAVGDVRLLADQATEVRLRDTLQARARWRAVHLACHGLVDPDRPLLSSLALAPGEGDDGDLSCLDVFRMKVSADLVVLSACETGKGKIYQTEGILGLTRAFMFAGAPRVICSLWKVDDAATRALMIKFYELWNPKDGSKGLGCAAALKKAQAFIQNHPDHPEWKHPYYWAAWVLWGLGS